MNLAANVQGWLIDATGMSHPGRRPVNEDAYLIAGALFAVADGVGGSPRGDLASRAAVDTLEAHEPDFDEVVDARQAKVVLDAATGDAGRAVEEIGERWQELSGAATTLCAAVIVCEDDHSVVAVAANVGDSRLYLLRNGGALQLTHDHTLATALGRGTGASSRYGHIITHALGGSDSTSSRADLFVVSLSVGDRLVLCTDGVTGVLEPQQIADLATERGDTGACARALVRAAWEAGSTDNITCVVVAIDRDPGQLSPPGSPDGAAVIAKT
jgi:protein phosphatase